MSYLFTTILYRESMFLEKFILEAIRETEAAFPKPHPHPVEYYVKVPIKNTISAVFYVIKGYSLMTKRFEYQREFFQEDDFLGLVWKCVKESGQPFCFYARLYNDMDLNYGVTYKFDNNRITQVQIIDGIGDIYYFPQDDQHQDSSQEFSPEMSKLEKKKFYNQYSDSMFLGRELGITDADLIHAFLDIDKGEIIFEYRS